MNEREVFLAAREHVDAAARAAFLAQACGDDVALHQRIERLLGADAAPDSIVDVSPVVAPQGTDADVADGEATADQDSFPYLCEDTPRPMTEIVPEVPPWMCGLVGLLHAKVPTKRISSAQEVARLLEAGEAGQAKEKARKRWVTMGLVLVVLLSLLGLSEYLGLTRIGRAGRELFAARTPPTRDEDEPKKANGQDEKPVEQILPPPVPEPDPDDPDRKAAEWAQSVDCIQVALVVEGKVLKLTSRAPLPSAPFRVVELVINRSPKVKDHGTEALGELRHLKFLQLTNSGQVGDGAMPHVGRCTQLKELILSTTHVTDKGLIHLTGLTELRWLSLKRTMVTKEGVEKLAAALPRCRIEWNGPTIEPRVTAP